MVIASSVLTSGLMPLGYTVVDEYLMGCILFGALLFVSVRRNELVMRGTDRLFRIHWLFFFAMVVYLLLQAARGLSEFAELRKIRWIAFFVLIGSLAAFLPIREFQVPDKRQLFRTVMLSTLVYFGALVVTGFVADFYGLYTEVGSMAGRWALQTTWWGSSAYSMLPVVVALPAITFSLQDRNRNHRRLAWVTFLVVIIAVLYWDSRVGALSILGFLLVGFRSLGVRRFVTGLLLIIVVTYMSLAFFLPDYGRDVKFFMAEYVGSGSALWAQAPGAGKDIDRWIHMKVVWPSLGDNWVTLLFGYGYRLSGLVISPHLAALYETYLPERAARIKEDESTEGITALVVETGLVGILLLGVNLIMVAWQVTRQSSRASRPVILWAVVLLALWLFVINILDITLFYLAIMPSGLLLQMARSPDKSVIPSRSLAVESQPVGVTR